MATKLQQLLDKIDYKNLFEADKRRVERVLSQYRSKRNTVENHDEFKKCLVEFVGQIYGAIINVPNGFRSASNSHMFSLAIDFLKSKYQGNTEITVYEIMHSGAEGGVYQILKTLAQIMTDKIYLDGVEHFIARFLDEISYDERTVYAKEYLNKYAYILPSNYKNDPNMVLISFDKVLREHAIYMKRLRNM